MLSTSFRHAYSIFRGTNTKIKLLAAKQNFKSSQEHLPSHVSFGSLSDLLHALVIQEQVRDASVEVEEEQSFYQAVCGNQQHTQRAAKHISVGVSGIVDKVQILLVSWEKKFKALWTTDKDAFIRLPFIVISKKERISRNSFVQPQLASSSHAYKLL